MASPSGLQFFSKCEPDGGAIRLSFTKQNDTFGIKFFLEVQEEGMGVKEEFVYYQ